MFALLDPRVWLVAVIGFAAAFGAGYFKGDRNADKRVRLEWTAATAAANSEARALEQRRQRRADEAGRMAAAREAGIRADASRARTAAGGLRDDLAAVRERIESLAAANLALRTTGDVLESCVAEYLRVAEEADRAYSEVKTLREAWPK